MPQTWTQSFEDGREDYFTQRLDQQRIERDAQYRAGADSAANDYEEHEAMA